MRFKNFIKAKREDAPNDVIVRKNRYILYLILLGYLCCMGVLAWGIRVATQVIGTGGGEQVIQTVVSIPIIVVSTLFRILLTDKLIDYFYYIAVITDSSIVKVKFSIFFKEELKIVELYRIQSIHSTQKGLMQGLLNYGTITLKIQGTGQIVFKYLPKPKRIIAKIEQMKEHITAERFALDDDSQS